MAALNIDTVGTWFYNKGRKTGDQILNPGRRRLHSHANSPVRLILQTVCH